MQSLNNLYFTNSLKDSQSVTPEELLIIFKAECTQIPITIELSKIFSIVKNVEPKKISNVEEYLKGIIFLNQEIIPVIDINKYLNLKNSKNYRIENEKAYSETIIINHENRKIGITGLNIMGQADVTKIKNQISISNFLTQIPFYSLAVYKPSSGQAEIIIKIEVEVIIELIFEELREKFLKQIENKNLNPSVKVTTPQIIGEERKESSFEINIFQEMVRSKYKTKQEVIEEYELIFMINKFLFSVDLENVYSVLRNYTIEEIPKNDNDYFIGLVHHQNQNVLVIDPEILIYPDDNLLKKNKKTYRNTEKVEKQYPVLIVLSHSKIKGLYGIPLNKINYTINKSDKHNATKNVFGICSEKEEELVDSIFWFDNQPTYHLSTNFLLLKIISRNLPLIGDLNKKHVITPIKRKIKEKEEELLERPILMSETEDQYAVAMTLNNVIGLKRKVFMIEEESKYEIQGWTPYYGEVVPIINATQLLDIISSPPNKENTFVFLNIGKEKEEIFCLEFPMNISLLKTSKEIKELTHISYSFLFETPFIEKILYISDKEKIVFKINEEQLLNKIIIVNNKLKKRKKQVEEVILKKHYQENPNSNYFELFRNDVYNERDRAVDLFIFYVKNALFGISQKHVVSFLGSYYKIMKSFKKEKKEQNNQLKNFEKMKMLLLPDFFGIEVPFETLEFIVLKTDKDELIMGIEKSVGIFFFDEKVLESSKEVKENKKIMNEIFLINEDYVSKNNKVFDKELALSLIEFSFEAPNYVPELSGKTIHVINIDKAIGNLQESFINWKDYFKIKDKEMEEK